MFVRSREEIFNFLKQLLSNGEVPKLKSLLDQMGKRELQHIDFLINLTSYYKTATHSLLQSIVDILEEDETNYKNLMRNFELSFSWLGKLTSLMNELLYKILIDCIDIWVIKLKQISKQIFISNLVLIIIFKFISRVFQRSHKYFWWLHSNQP